jgi:FeS assembly SUF system regulator
MIRISRLTDYGIMLMTHLAQHGAGDVRTARDLSAEAHLPAPTVSKILKQLARQGLLEAHRGARGGFSLSRPASAISILEVIRALEGPFGITECSAYPAERCELELRCPVGRNWQIINRAVRSALEAITLADMARPLPQTLVPAATRSPVEPRSARLPGA